MAFREKLKDLLFSWRSDSERDGSQHEIVRRYPLVDPAKIGYAMLLGSDHLVNDDSHLQSVTVDLTEMDKSLRSCGIHVSSLSQVNNHIVKFDRAVYGSAMTNVRSMAEHQLDYGFFLFYYSGHGSHHGILTADGDCIQYSEIVRDFGLILSSSGMPRVFVFDCCRKVVNVNQPITRDLLEQEVEPGLLTDTIMCFSTLDSKPSWGIKKGGSFFTREFATALRLYHQTLPLTEIIVQASGRARGRMCTALKNSSEKLQSDVILSQPVFYSFLSAMLLLTPTHKSFLTTDYKHSDELKEWFDNHLQNLESKGDSDQSVETQDSVLIIHALDVTVSDNLEQLCNLAVDLENNNFTVCLDVWRQSDDLSRNSLLYWYTANITLSSHVVVVLSTELTKASSNTDNVLGKVWSAVCTVMSSNETDCKFYPVHLRLEDTEHRLSVFGGTIYNMANSADCSKLVKHMRGQPIDRPQPGQVTVLGKKQAAASGDLPADLASLFQTKKGYRTVTHPSRASPHQTTQSLFYPAKHPPAPPTQHYSASATPHPPAPPTQHYPATQHPPAPPTQHYPATQHPPAPPTQHYPATQHPPAPPTQHYPATQHPPAPPTQHYPATQHPPAPPTQHYPATQHPPAPPTQHYPATQHPPAPPTQHYPATQHPPAPPTQHYPATQHPPAPPTQHYPATQHPPAPAVSIRQSYLHPYPPSQHAFSSRLVLNRPISIASILWLSERIIEWKFVGRYLGLEESELKRIESDNAGKMGEQCYQMLYRWQQMTPCATCCAVLEALQRTKCGPTLINEFVTHIETQEENEEQ